MQKLLIKQKKLLDKWFKEYQPLYAKNLKEEHLDELVAIKDFAYINNAIDEYLWQKMVKGL